MVLSLILEVNQISKIKVVFFSEAVGSFETKFHMKAYGRMGFKINKTELGHMTKMAAMPIYGKSLSNPLWNQWTDGLGIWYVASGTRVLPRMFKWLP